MANRMKEVFPETISPHQSAFMRGHQISDNILIAHEVLRFLKKDKSNNHHMAIKLDLSKAYDHVEWSMILDMMKQVGFNENWRDWIKECMGSVTYKTLINGSFGKVISYSRGLRQGDPLSSFLFLLCVEGLSAFFINLERLNAFFGIKINRSCLAISHLLFADNCHIFLKVSPSDVNQIKECHSQFSTTLGQIINQDKS